jgi:hypothetical protein
VTCDQCQDLLPPYAAGALDPAEREAVRAHVAAGCPRCAVELAEAEATVAQLPLALDEITPSAGARAKLMERVTNSTPSQSAPSTMRITPETAAAASHRRGWLSYAAAACIGGLVAAIAVQSVYRDIYRNRIAKLNGTIASMQKSMDDQNVTLAQLTRMIDSPDLRMVAFETTDKQTGAKARLLWDAVQHKWHINVFDMKPPKPGQAYELWFFGDDPKPMPGPMLHVDQSGNGKMTVDVPQSIGLVKLAAFTNEPEQGMDAPTGDIHLKAEMLKN